MRGNTSFGFTNYSEQQKPKFYGKYRARVTKNRDPERQGRIKVECPAVLGKYESAWALPCFPPNWNHINNTIPKLPRIGSLVWVEFEEGNSDKPIWVGSWWRPQDAPKGLYD